MMALLGKELRASAAYWFAIVLGLVFVVLDHAIPAMVDWPRSRVLDHQNMDWVFLAGLLAFALGHRTVAHEYRDGHIEFLDGLPVRRWQVFVAKLVAVATPLAVLALGSVLIKGITVWALDTPGGLPITETLVVLGLRYAVILAAFAGLGLLASWAGGLGWGVVVILTFGMLTMSIVTPSLRPYVLMEGMIDLDYAHARPVHQWGPLVVWSAVAAGCTLLSGLLFLGPGKWLVRAGTWSVALVRVGGVGCGAALFLSCAGLASIQVVITQGAKMLTPTERVSTEHFRVLYPTASRDVAAPLVAEVDAISAQVGAMMGHDEPLALQIEMMGAGRAHAGRFTGGKITLNLAAEPRATLAHELAHAHAFAMSGWGVEHQFEHVRFFEEGLAQFFENRFIERPVEHALPAAMWKTGQARFDLLVEDSLRGETHDSDQAYPLGEVFVEALVTEHGVESVGCLLQAFGQLSDASVSGLSLWMEGAGRCDVDLDAVVGRYDALLADAALDLPVLPDLAWRVDRTHEEVVVIDAMDTRMDLVCRFRDDVDAERYQWDQTDVGVDGRCRIPTGSLSGTSYEVQVGFVMRGEEWPVFLPWSRVER